MYRYIATFLTGSLVPTICIYLTGGSNRTNLMIGLVLGILATVIPVIRWRNSVARILWAMDDGFTAFLAAFLKPRPRGDGEKAPKPAPTPTVAPATLDMPVPAPTPVVVPPNPMIGDVASALHNMGTPYKQALRIARQVAAHQVYERFEDMFRDAVGVAKVARTA